MSDDEFEAEDFKWVRGVANKPVDFEDEKFTLQDGGKTVKVMSKSTHYLITPFLMV